MVLIFDIETKTFGKPNPDKDEFRFIGAKDSETKEKYFYGVEDKEKIKELFKKYRGVVSFNGDHYDIPILRRFGVWGRYNLSIDLRVVIKKRGFLIEENGVGLDKISNSLNSVSKFFGGISKLDFNYDILKKDKFTAEDIKYIQDYTENDVEMTELIFNKLSEFFEPFKEGLSSYDIQTYKWLTCSTAVYSYKVICNETGMKEEYEEGDIEHIPYKGGLVFEPSVAEKHGNIYCLDFSSLYPSIFIQCNLFSTKYDDRQYWNGDGFFNVEGKYNNRKQGKIEEEIKKLYITRQKYKKLNDKRQYSYKIALNSLYGAVANPVFKNIYNKTTASDCCLIGRKCLEYAKEIFERFDYKILYGDTDSIYLEDPHNDKEQLKNVLSAIIKGIQNHMPFPFEPFKMDIDYEIKHIWFIKSGEKYNKKTYIFVTKKDEVIIKGLPMIKSDATKLSKKIYKKYLEENVKNGKLIHDFEDVKKYINEMLEQNINLICRRFKVWKKEEYKLESQLQCQISNKYGEGVHLLIPNNQIGVGKSTKFCTIEEFKDSGNNINSLILNKVWKELSPFIDETSENIIAKAMKDKKNDELLKWIEVEE